MSTEQDQMYADIFTTAIEGGVNYWASVLSYKWTLPNSEQDLVGFRAVVIDQEEDGAEPQTIDRAVIVRGVREMSAMKFNPGSQAARCSKNCTALSFGRNLDDLDFDADDADMIVQAGLFGEVVYG